MIRVFIILLVSVTPLVSVLSETKKAHISANLINLSVEELRKEESTYETSRKIAEQLNKETIRPVWARSCVSEVHEKRNRDFSFNRVSENGAYIFFSLQELHDINSNLSLKSLNFYKSKDFSSAPVFSIDRDGLKKDGTLICSWNLPYSEAYLYNLSFKKCNPELVKYLSSYKLIGEEGSGPGDLCHVLNPTKVEKDPSGNYTFQFLIGKETYYLDTREMENVRNGKYVFSLELLAEKRQIEKSARALSNKDVLDAISKHQMFLKLKLCLKSKNVKCIDSYTNEEFSLGLGADADRKICGLEVLGKDEIKECVKSKKDIIRKASKMVAQEFVNFVENSKGELFRVKNENGTFSIEYFKNGDPETQFVQKFKVDINDNSLMFSNYVDGYSC